ncbi:hypothetical protein J5U23_01407 [Saccharolobus shibatae B12]|uniref:Uncharacterized protein n=1 Tax=Saccharolobus shibatae (strain ATCC 51178 / DSM 5389 / JCM 8931 / NBRC 15437 / B12) TaxID=523848 RepID=A0A8F5BNS7_SACSH|nr:hypothetical protein [Saccharolobus shibatae]QXJ28538.1 hypothetical protein J5U23_01407 [Saccharolobus shibatae B12]
MEEDYNSIYVIVGDKLAFGDFPSLVVSLSNMENREEELTYLLSSIGYSLIAFLSDSTPFIP